MSPLYRLDPRGTVWDMTGEKRPRIRPELVERIDRVRGDVPFERWVNRILENNLPLIEAAWRGREGLPPLSPEAAQEETIRIMQKREPPESFRNG